MNKVWRARILLINALSIVSIVSNAATLFVESLDDALGSAATLRQTILNASSGDSILFNVSGTITLDEALGQLVIDKQLIIDGQNKVVIDGGNLINVCFFITGISAANSEIQNLTMQNFNGHITGTVPQELPARGILIDPNATGCTISNTTIKNIHSGVDQDATGIASFAIGPVHTRDNTITLISSEDNQAGESGIVRGIGAAEIGDCIGNVLSDFTSGAASSNSGNVIGIESFVLVGDCANNQISNLFSGVATNNSGNVYGIFVFSSKNCLNNIVSKLESGAANNLGGQVIGIVVNQLTNDCLNNVVSDISGINTAGGIQLFSVEDGKAITCNTVLFIANKEEGVVFGIEIESGNQLSITSNTVNTIENCGDDAHGLLLGGDAENTFITNSEIVSNVILNIVGKNNSGFGITIINNQSVGNDLLSNSVSYINGAAIHYEDTLTDGVVTLSSIECSGRFVTISGTLFPDTVLFGKDFLLQFFVSALASPVQIQLFIGEQVITSGNGPTQFSVMFEPTTKLFSSQFVTATATVLPGSVQNLNTSVVSNALFGCTSSLAGLCNIVSICPNDASLPVPECPIPEVCELCIGSC